MEDAKPIALPWRLTAEHFDETELKTIRSMFITALGIEGTKLALTARQTKGKTE